MWGMAHLIGSQPMNDEVFDQFVEESRFRIDMNKIDEEIDNQPAVYSYYATMYVRAKEVEGEARLTVKEVEADVRLKLKDLHRNDKPKPTVDDLNSMVELDVNVKEARKALLKAQIEAQQIEQDRQSSWMKAEMLKLRCFEARRQIDSMKSGGF
jgi:hypothetical protein